MENSYLLSNRRAITSRIKTAGLILLPFFLSSFASAQHFLLPENLQFSSTETYDIDGTGQAQHITLNKDSEHYMLSAPSHPSGLGVFQANTGQKANTSGKVTYEVYIVPSRKNLNPEHFYIKLGGQHTVRTDHSTNKKEKREECPAGLECDTDENTLSSEDGYHIFTNALGSTLVSPEVGVQKIVITNIKAGQFDALHPTVQIADSECKLGSPGYSSHCRDLQAVIIRLIPESSAQSVELTIHLLTPEAVAHSEKRLQIVGTLISPQMKSVWMGILNALFPYRPNQDTSETTHPVYTKLLQKGVSQEILMEMLTDIANREKRVWKKGTCSGTMYCGDEAFYAEQNKVFALFSANNALQADMHPGARKFEAETVAMTLELLGGEHLVIKNPEDDSIIDQGTGFITSGGTISNMSAMMTYEKIARARGISNPVIIASKGIHTSIKKAAYTYNFELIEVELDPETLKMDTAKIKSHLEENRNIVAVVASAPDYGLGSIDPIEELSDIVMSYRNKGREIFLHVDACMGGFILPFVHEFIDELNEEACNELEAMKLHAGQTFDRNQCYRMSFPKVPYSYPGVTSVSADLHKYGKTIKGLSVITFRNHALVKPQYFSHPDWLGGASITHGPNGSRSQGLLAVAYYTMLRMGYSDYVDNARNIIKTAHRFQNIVRMHPELKILGTPSMVFAFASDNSDELNTMHIADMMTGMTPSWRFNPIQNPSGLHFCVTGPQLFNIEPDDSFSPASLTSDPFIPESLYKDFSDATRLFSRDLALAIPRAKSAKAAGRPALTGSMYGMGAAGIPIEDPLVADAILQAGKHITLQTDENGLEPLYKRGRNIVDQHIHEKLGLPAY